MRNVLPILIALLPITGGCYGKKNHTAVVTPKPKKGTHISGNNHIPENIKSEEDKIELTIPLKDPPPGPVDSRESPEPIDGEVELKIGKGEYITISYDQNVALELVIDRPEDEDCVQILEENGENVSKTEYDKLLAEKDELTKENNVLLDKIRERENYCNNVLLGEIEELTKENNVLLDKIREWENYCNKLEAEKDELINKNNVLLENIWQSGDSSTATHKKNLQRDDAEIQEIVKKQVEEQVPKIVEERVQDIENILRARSVEELDTIRQNLERKYREELDKLKGDIQTLKTKNKGLEKNKKWLKDRLEDLRKRFDEELKKAVDQCENEIKEKYKEEYKEEYKEHLLTMGIEIDTLKIEIDTLKNTLREKETKEHELNCKLDEKEKRIKKNESENESEYKKLLEAYNQLIEAKNLLAINLDNAEAKLRILVEERNKLEVINENLQTALDELWDKYQTLGHDCNNPQGGNRSEDETFTFGEDKNGPKHRRGYSAPPEVLLSIVQQERVGKE